MLKRKLLITVFIIGVPLTARAGECTYLQTGIASIYSEKLEGHRTTSGERLDMAEATVAHRRLPFGTRIRITDKRTGKSTYARVNDRGPFIKKRVVDVSGKARRELGWGRTGTHKVAIAVCP